MSHSLKISVLLSVFGLIEPSNEKISGSDKDLKEVDKYLKQQKKEVYEKYFEQQKQIYKELLSKHFPGVCPLKIDEYLAEEILANGPQEVSDLVSNIEQNVFSRNTNFFYGVSGTGKTSLAQAVAIKTQTPCLFFNAGELLAEHMKSGGQNLEKIFEYAQRLKERSGKPCVIIFDKLEILTKREAGKKDQENNTLSDLLGRLDDLSNNEVILIGTMDEAEKLSDQIIGKTSAIELPLPNREQRESVFSYYLKKIQDKFGITCSECVTPAILAWQTNGYSHKDLQSLMQKAANPLITARALSDENSKILTYAHYSKFIKQSKKKSRSKFVDNLCKRFFRMPKNPVAWGALVTTSVGLFFHQKNADRQMDLAERGLDQGKELAEKQMALTERGLIQAKEIAEEQRKLTKVIAEDQRKLTREIAEEQRKQSQIIAEEQRKQAQAIADRQVSDEHMVKQAQINDLAQRLHYGPLLEQVKNFSK